MFGLFATKNYENLRGTEFKEKFIASPGPVLIDVRTPGEFRSGSINGARNLDMMSPSFVNHVETLDKTRNISTW